MDRLGDVAAALGHPSVMVIIGLAVFLGTVGGRLFERLRIPQVVGNIFIGLILGRSVLRVIDAETITGLQPFGYLALAVIGFLIGGELHRDVFRKYGWRFLTILLAEGMGAFLLVGLLVGASAWLLTGDAASSAALAVVLGAISSATAPAATVNVLWEYRARGPLTTTVFAIVALDDALALILFSFAAGAATLLTGYGSGSILASLGVVAWELLGGAILGALLGLVLDFLIRRAGERGESLAFILGALILDMGFARMIDVDPILSAMALGFTIVNLAPGRSDGAFKTVEGFAPPIFVLFFVMVGAQLDVGGMTGWMWIIALAYVLGRTLGKFAGSSLGAKWANAAPAVRKYLGLCLFSQAGVAVGLSISAGHRFSGELGSAVVMIVALTTFLVQVIGPPSVRHAIRKAGEAGMRVTEEDLLRSFTAGEMALRDIPSFAPGTPLDRVLDVIAGTDHLAYPVLGDDGRLLGTVSIREIRRSFMSCELNRILVAFDMMEPAERTVDASMPLDQALALMRRLGVEYLPVVSADGRDLVGMLEPGAVHGAVSRELMRRQQIASAEI